MEWKNSIRSQVILWCDTYFRNPQWRCRVRECRGVFPKIYRVDGRRRYFVRIAKCGNHWFPRNRRWRVIGHGVNCGSKPTSNLVIRRADGMLINITECCCNEGMISKWPFRCKQRHERLCCALRYGAKLASQNYRALTQITKNIQTLCANFNNKIQKSILDINSAVIGYV